MLGYDGMSVCSLVGVDRPSAMGTIFCVGRQYGAAMRAAAMATLIAVKQRGKGQPRTASGTDHRSRTCQLTAGWTHFGFLHHIGAKAVLLKLKVFCLFCHSILPLLYKQAPLRTCCIGCHWLPLPFHHRICNTTGPLRMAHNRRTPKRLRCTLRQSPSFRICCSD